MGMNVAEGLLAYSNAISQQSRSIPQRFTSPNTGLTQFGNPFSNSEYKPPLPNAGRANVPTNPATLNMVSSPPPSTSTGLFDAPESSLYQGLLNRNQNNRPSNENFNYRYLEAQAGARPPVLTLSDAVRLNPGYSVDAVKSMMAELGYTYEADSRGGVLRLGANGATNDGTTPIGNAPGSGYTWSNGAWHAPAGEDPYSDIKSVYMSKNRGYVTPEVANLLRRKRRRRMEERQVAAAAQKAQPTESSAMSSAGTINAAGLVTLRANFG